jgi:hypothetical protein
MLIGLACLLFEKVDPIDQLFPRLLCIYKIYLKNFQKGTVFKRFLGGGAANLGR